MGPVKSYVWIVGFRFCMFLLRVNAVYGMRVDGMGDFIQNQLHQTHGNCNNEEIHQMWKWEELNESPLFLTRHLQLLLDLV